jgi:DNA repair protein RadC
MGNNFKSRASELKPRERIESLGPATSLSAEDLLAIILKTGASGCDVAELSRRLLDAFDGIEELVRTDYNSLKAVVSLYNKRNTTRKILGLGRVKMLELTAAFELARRGYGIKTNLNLPIESSDDAANIFRKNIKNDTRQESFWVLPLDGKKRPLSEPQSVAVGAANVVSIYPREVFSCAIKWNACAVIVAHNHPGGFSKPSRVDLDTTETLRSVFANAGIEMLCHYVVAEGEVACITPKDNNCR